MSEPWETSIYPIVKTILMESPELDMVSEDDTNYITNSICQAIDKRYKIEKKL